MAAQAHAGAADEAAAAGRRGRAGRRLRLGRLLGWALGLPPHLLQSLAPKAIAAPVAMGIADALGGPPELAAVFVLITGLVGAIGGQYLLRVMGVRDPCIVGFALGAQSHGFGTARALHVHPDAGAFAGLALGMQALLGALLIPLAALLLGH